MAKFQSEEEFVAYYSDVFNTYLEEETMPEDVEPNDTLADYLRSVLDDPSNRHLCESDPVWRRLFDEALISFFQSIYPHWKKAEQQSSDEMEMCLRFESSDINGKRKQWRSVEVFITCNYSEKEIPIRSYTRIMRAKQCKNEAVLQTLVNDWKKMIQNKEQQQKFKSVSIEGDIFEAKLKRSNSCDYEIYKQYSDSFRKYPHLQEIIQIMGRAEEAPTKRMDNNVPFNYLPQLISTSPSMEETKGVQLGNRIPSALPSELVLLSDDNTDSLFYYHFATHGLQQWSAKPPQVRPIVQHHEQEQKRLEKGPLIVCIDTSQSMSGRNENVAKGALLEIVQLAHRQHRSCFLISFSIRANCFDASAPGSDKEVRRFIESAFCGGTDGNDMLKEILRLLKTQKYELADVLIISDFEWDTPRKEYMTERYHQGYLGTRFYGLSCGITSHGWLDMVWSI